MAYSGLFFLGLIDNARGPSYPLMLSQFQITPAVGSLMFSLASGFALLSTVLSKFWFNRFGLSMALTLFVLVMLIGSALIGFSGYLVGSNGVLILMIGSCFLGFGMGGTGIAMNVLVGESVPPNMQRKAYSGLHSLYGISSLIVPLLLSGFIAFGGTWFQFFIILSLIPLPMVYWGGKLGKSENKLVDEKKIEKDPPRKLFYIFGMMFALYVASEIILSTRLVYFMMDTFGLSNKNGGFYLSGFFLGLTIGRLSFSMLHFPGSNLIWMGISLLSSALFFILGLTIWPIFLSLCGLTMSIFFPCGMTYVNEMYPHSAKKIISFTMMCILTVIMVSHFGIGLISRSFSLAKAMWIGVIYLILALLLCAKLKTEVPKK